MFAGMVETGLSKGVVPIWKPQVHHQQPEIVGKTPCDKKPVEKNQKCGEKNNEGVKNHKCRTTNHGGDRKRPQRHHESRK